MKISVDFGAVAGDGYFGTKIFAVNFREAVRRYDKKNQYIFYDFASVKPGLLWSTLGLSLAEWKNQPDFFLALNQAIPLYVSGKIVSFCHGLSYFFFPNCYSLKDRWRLKTQFSQMISRSGLIVVSSKKVKEELKKIARDKFRKFVPIAVIPFGVPFDVLEFREIREIKERFFLIVAKNQPIKNINFSIRAFLKLRKINRFKNYFLFVVTDMVTDLIKDPNVKYFTCLQRKELINLYSQTQALLTASFYESFNFPILEALAFGKAVVGLQSAVIPEFYPYVYVARNENEFLNHLKSLKFRSNEKTTEKVKREFNWQRYLSKLLGQVDSFLVYFSKSS
ncbi:MAG: glycosyltransferase [Patescibacteria group bacterium]|nr:glycosyltransferase [Patescibacteria group bacterium]